MPATATCPHCQGLIQVEEVLRGQPVQCPLCGQMLVPPTSVGVAQISTLHMERRIGLAVTSLIFGILGLCSGGLLGLIGVILGIVVLVKAGSTPTVDRGRGFAVAGIATGAASFLFVGPMLIAILLPSLARARELAKRSVCQQNLQAIHASFSAYAKQQPGLAVIDGKKFLDAESQQGRLRGCPSADPDLAPSTHYALVVTADCADPDRILMYEDPAIHGDGGNVLFCDGHVMFTPVSDWNRGLSDGGVAKPIFSPHNP